MATTNAESTSIDAVDDPTTKAPEGIVIPPRQVREYIERVAHYVARNGLAFEDKVRQNNTSSNRTSFLNPDDAYNAYYKWRVEEVKAGRGADPGDGSAAKTDVSFQGKVKKGPEKPDDFQFSARMPIMSSEDQDVIKLTAQYGAKNGRPWITALSQREAGNPQFDFLRPTHSYNMYFTRLMEQYKILMDGETAENGKAQLERIAELERNVNDRGYILDKARKRAEYTKHQEAQKVEKEEKAEKDRIAFAEIDWHDFVVVETITFDERDANVELPPPMRLNDLLSKSLEQRAAMRIGSDKRIEEAAPTFGYEEMNGMQPQHPAEEHPNHQPPFAPQATPTYPAAPGSFPYYQPPGEEPSRVATLQAERERARAIQEAAKASQPAARIRNDYVPQAARRKQAQATSICPNCKQAIPNDEMAEHMHIEMLHPQWREQNRINQQRSATSNLSTAEMANNLKRLASQRTDVFDPVTGQPVNQEEQDRLKRAGTESYEDVNQAPNPATHGQQFPLNPFPSSNQTTIGEQIRQLHEKYNK